MPQVKVGEYLELNNITATERFSRSPFRYSEASLVKKMEDLGIGRPSTYAPTITTIQNRKYVEKGSSDGNERNYVKLTLYKGKIKSEKLTERFGMDKGKLVPTDIGMIVNDFLVENFKAILDFNFTAEVERNFDDIARGSKDWSEMLKVFYNKFHNTVEDVKQNAQKENQVNVYLGKIQTPGG